MNRSGFLAGAVIALALFAGGLFADVIAVDDSDGPPTYTETGEWRTTSAVGSGYAGTEYRFHGFQIPPATATWRPDLPAAGAYEVIAVFLRSGNRTARAPYTIEHANGSTVVELDQTGPFSGDLSFESLGSYLFEEGTAGSVTLSTNGGSGTYIADAILFQVAPPPVIMDVRRAPLYPQEDDDVLVIARIAEPEAIAEVRLLWSVGDDALDLVETASPHEIGEGDAFAATLPAQPEGTTVFYAVEAEDGFGATTVGDTMQYTVGETGNWTLVINEVMASNSSTIAEPDFGGFDDWVEIYNFGPDTADLGGLHFSDRLNNPTKWAFPPGITIEPGEYFLVWCNGRDYVGKAVHTNFSLSASGEDAVLYDAATDTILDSISWTDLATDKTIARIPDLTGEWSLTAAPTPGAPNELEVRGEPPVFSHPSGLYADPIDVEIEAPGASAIRYTTDGSWPSASSTLYESPLTIQSTTGLRARAWYDDASPGRTTSASYFFGVPEDRLIPVMNIVIDPDDLFDPATGIYPNFNERGREWEREVHVSVFSPDGTVSESTDAGVRIHGGFSRGAPKKSMRLYFRNDYGDNTWSLPWLEHSPVDEIRHLVLRAGGNDGFLVTSLEQRRQVTYIRDQIIRDWFRDQGHYAVDGFFVALYLNGQYWGLYNPVERVTEPQMASVFGDGEDYDVIKGGWTFERKFFTEANDGDMEAWEEFLAWHQQSDLTDDEDFDELLERIDFQNYLDWMALNIAVQNEDWPHNNWIATRHRSREDARWVFHEWDAEWALGLRPQGWTSNTIRWARGYNFHLSPSHNGTLAPLSALFAGNVADTNATETLHGVLDNPRGRTGFLRALEDVLNFELQPDKAITQFDDYADLIRSEISREAHRWASQSPASAATLIGYWNDATENKRDFLRNRPDAIRDIAEDEFDLDGRRTVTIVAEGTGSGRVLVRGREVALPWTGTWFDGSDVELQAIADSGSTFVEWSGVIESTDAEATYATTVGADATLVVVFDQLELGSHWYLH